MKSFQLIFVFAVSIFFFSCSKSNVEPEGFGNIEGFVINSNTEDGEANVNITTTPPSSSLLTNDDGSFTIRNIPEGGYTVQARKPNFRNSSVSVFVRDNSSSEARILLEPNPDDQDSQAEDDIINAEVTSWFNAVSGDSSFVEVEYMVENISLGTDAAAYEVYFEIETSGDTFFFDAEGTNLEYGKKSFKEFKKFIRSESASSVTVSGTWFNTEPDPDSDN